MASDLADDARAQRPPGDAPAAAAADGAAARPPVEDAPSRPRKAPSAFRTISEVAEDLHIPQHVLRFWESKFPQLKPLKRGGGRRYYRPDDILLLRRVSDLLYIQGYTIKGVQRLLRDGGGRLSDDIPPPTTAEREAAEVGRRLKIALWVWFALTTAATIHFGWHYVADDLAGVLMGAAALGIARWMTGIDLRALRERRQLASGTTGWDDRHAIPGMAASQ